MKLLDLLRSPKPSVKDLRSALGAIDIPAAEAEVTRLSAERAAILMDADDKTLDALEAKIAAARRQVERATILQDQTTAALQDAEAREAAEALTTERGKVEAEANAVAKALRTQYPKIATELVALLNRLETAESAVRAMNGTLRAAGRDSEMLQEVETRAFPVGQYHYAPHQSLFSRVTLPEKPGLCPGFNDRPDTGGAYFVSPTATPMEDVRVSVSRHESFGGFVDLGSRT